MRCDGVREMTAVCRSISDGLIRAPLSHQQRQLWFQEEMRPNHVTSNLLFGARLIGGMEFDALRRALESIAARHEAIRTAFAEVDGEPYQCVAPVVDIDLSVDDLSSASAAEQNAALSDLVLCESARPFDLSAPPPLRAKLARLSEREHVLVRTHHHIAYDGFSDQILMQELLVIYNAYAKGEGNPLQIPAGQYIEYARLQLLRARNHGFDEGLNYWERELAGVPGRLDLPLTRRRSRVRDGRGATVIRQFGAELHTALKQACRSQGVTTFMFMLATLEMLLARWSGQSDFAIGTPMSNRSSTFQTSIGCFANMVLLRSDLRGVSTFRDLVQRVRQRCLDSYRYQDVPLDLLLRRLARWRDLRGDPPIQVAFNALNYPRPSHMCDELSIEGLPYWQRINYSRFELTLYVLADHALTVTAAFDVDLFERRAIDELIEQWRGLLVQAISDPNQSIYTYSLVTAAAKAVLPDPTVPLHTDTQGTVLARFESQRLCNGDRIAVTCGEQSLTYDRVAALSTRIAATIPSGKRAEPVAVLARRSIDLVPTLMGVLRAGAMWLLIDGDMPVARIASLIVKSGARCILDPTGNPQLRAALEGMLDVVPPYVLLSINDLSTEHEADALPHSPISPDSLAYVAFTSGSTGEPKAVVGTHGPLTHFVQWYAAHFDLGPSDRFSQLSAIGHDPMLRDIFVPLATGGTICIPACSILDRDAVLTWAAREQVTVMHLSPAFGRVLTAESSSRTLPSLTLACFGGDVLTSADVTAMTRLAPVATILNAYGATETPQIMSHWSSQHVADQSNHVIPLGKAIQDAQLLVMREDLRSCGIHERGEILVRTPHLTIGYLNDSCATREKYVPNVYTDDANDRMYRTGDLGWYGPDGNVYYAGRLDRQVKVHGFRVDPSEVEAVLLSHRYVTDAIIVKSADAQGDDRLAGYVATKNRRLTTRLLRRSLARVLPPYMVPSILIVMQAIPRTATGKIDVEALPMFVSPIRDSFSPPRDDVERSLCAIVGEAVGVHHVGIDDDFFDLGGDSMAAVCVTGRTRAIWQVDVSVRDLFAAPSVRGLSAVVRTRCRQARISCRNTRTPSPSTVRSNLI